MPRKGLPRCNECGWFTWRLVRDAPTRGHIICGHCSHVVITKSPARHRLEQIHEAAEAATEELDE